MAARGRSVCGAVRGGGRGTFKLKNFDLAVSGELVTALLLYEEEFVVAGSKWQFAKAAGVKVAKDGVTEKSGISRESEVILVDESAGKTNLSGLKLSYTAKSGLFKGSFKAYSLAMANGRKKLVKHTVNVAGFVVGGKGYGEATCKKPTGGPWPVTVE